MYVLDHTGKPYRKFFEDISAFPRNSFKEKEVAAYIVQFAKDRGLEWYEDDIWNVIIKKPASPGYGNHPPVMIQGHTDMVCVKTPDSKHDFDKDPLDLYVEDGYLKARDTSLGADCGHGIAYMLAILDDKTLKHPPLEAFFSVQEENGIGGPRGVDYSKFTAKTLINTDNMNEGTSCLSTGSVVGGYFYKLISFAGAPVHPAYEIRVSGLTGGHAAVDIIKDRANAIKIAVRAAAAIRKEDARLLLCDISGGDIKNNIPVDCKIVFCGSLSLDAIQNIAAETEKFAAIEYKDTDPNLSITVSGTSGPEKTLDSISTRGVLDILQAVSTGVFHRSQSVPNFALGSRNMGTVEITGNTLKFGYMFRGAYKHLLRYYMDQVFPLMERFGAVYEEEYRYSGYNTSPDTPLNKLYAQVYKELTGKDVVFDYTHGGTDVGTIADNIPGLDAIHMGPDTIHIHTPREALNLDSFDRVYKYFITMLERL
jgi:dipeptidase D